MKYLFFDIECASVTKTVAKICVFGYVLCDENFEVIEKEDILINPDGGFHLTDKSGENGIVLPYDYRLFKKQPTFPEFYPRIKALLEDADTLVCGHSVMNDVNFLKLDSMRYNLDSFEFSFVDTQVMYMAKISSYERQYGLEFITAALGINFTPHMAMDDAYASMMIARSLCEEEGCNLCQLCEKYALVPGSIHNNVIQKVSTLSMKRHYSEQAEKKMARNKNKAEFCDFASGAKPAKSGKFKGEVFAFCNLLEYEGKRAIDVLKIICANGGRFTHKVENATIYVTVEGEKGQRLKNAQERGLKIINAVELEGEI